MFGTSVPWRSLVIPTLAVGLGVVVQHGSHDPPLRPQPPLPVLVVLPPPPVQPVVVSPPPMPSPFDLRHALAEIGRRTIAAHRDRPDLHAELIPADGPCVRPDVRDQRHLVGQIASWVDTTYSDERPNAATELGLRFGCIESNGIVVVEGVAERTAKDSERPTTSRSWIWEVELGGRLSVVDERISTPTNDWMEWANEGTLAVNALIDLDHDGVRDLVTTKEEHEGGGSRSDYVVSVKRGAKLEPIVKMNGVLSSMLVDHRVVLELGDNRQHLGFRCIGADLRLASCPAANAARATAEMLEIANDMIHAPALDRELLAEQLRKLHVSEAESAPILAAANATTPAQRAERHVMAFLDHRPDGDLRLLDLGAHVAAAELFASVRSQLGDAPCVASQLSNETAGYAIDRWVNAHAPANKQRLVVNTVCDDYAWAAWDVGETRHESLLFVEGDEILRVVEFTFSNVNDTEGPGTAHDATFFRHGNTIVGEVIHTGDHASELLAIANGRIVGKRRGAFEPYFYDQRSGEISDDLVTDRVSWWHATPAGLERIDPEALLPHEAERHALEAVEPFDVSRAQEIAKALSTLGADRALVREVGALAP